MGLGWFAVEPYLLGLLYLNYAAILDDELDGAVLDGTDSAQNLTQHLLFMTLLGLILARYHQTPSRSCATPDTI